METTKMKVDWKHEFQSYFSWRKREELKFELLKQILAEQRWQVKESPAEIYVRGFGEQQDILPKGEMLKAGPVI